MMSTRFELLLNRYIISRSMKLGKISSNVANKTDQLARLAWPYVMLMYCGNGCCGVKSRNMTCETSERLLAVTVAARRQSGGNAEIGGGCISGEVAL